MSALLRLAHVQCDWGGTGVSSPGHFALMLSFDVAASAQVEGLRVLEITLLDEAHAVLTRAIAPIELRVLVPGLDEHHNPRTLPFDGSVESGATLRLRAVAELAPMAGAIPRGSRYLATVRAGEDLEFSGPVEGSWPTAGPASAR